MWGIINKMEENFKSGFVAIIGKPNAGKSTLLNSLVGQKISIVSPKPQTTRNKILGVLTEENTQMVFVDTPGLLQPKNTLGEFMKKSIDSGIKDVDAIVYVIDGHKEFSPDDLERIEKYAQGKIPVIVAVNKIDITQPEKLIKEVDKLNELKNVKKVYTVSAANNKNIAALKEGLRAFLTDDNRYFADDDVTDRPQAFIVTEIIREKILLLTDEEIPHGIGVTLNKMRFNEVKSIWEIDANIIVEKAGHKPIIIGKKGTMLKEIGSRARISMENMLGSKVYLTLWVKIKEDWRNSEFLVKEVGYNKKDV